MVKKIEKLAEVLYCLFHHRQRQYLYWEYQTPGIKKTWIDEAKKMTKRNKRVLELLK